MQTRKYSGLLISLCLSLVAATGCGASRPTRPFSNLQQVLKPGNSVYVVDNTGAETKGKVVAVSSSALMLEVDGVPRSIGQDSVSQVQRYGDPLWNGFVIGAAVATPAILLSDPAKKPCGVNLQRRCGEVQVGQRVLAIGIMGLIGTGIDALIRRRHSVYEAPPYRRGP
jgi:hypothetical protein